jgi:hypothetical protein
MRGAKVPDLSMFSSKSEKDESEEDELEDEDLEEEDKVAPGVRGPQNGASSKISFFNVFQFTITGEKSSRN